MSHTEIFFLQKKIFNIILWMGTGIVLNELKNQKNDIFKQQFSFCKM